MTITEAEEYYKEYLGYGFHMCREEPGRYEYFRRLNLPAEVLARWDEELLDAELEKMRTDAGRTWAHQGNVIGILARGKCNAESGVSRLLDAMEFADGLALFERTLIVENMAGRTAGLKDGGVCLVCTKTKQAPRMKRVMEERLLPDDSGDTRHAEAVRRYGDALRRFGKR